MNPSRIQSLDDLMDLALVLERRAAERYHWLADKMERNGRASLAALFRRLAAAEDGHAQAMGEVAGGRGEELLSSMQYAEWQVDSPGAVYAEEAQNTGMSSEYKALALAVHNEERAFALYTEIAAHSEDRELRRRAEALAKEELSHAALLRVERRRAYHAGRRKAQVDGALPPPKSLHTLAQFYQAALQIELGLIARLNLAARDHETALLALHSSREILARVGGSAAGNPTPAEGGNPDQALSAAIADSEQAFAYYDTVVAVAADEDMLLAAQELAAAALDRLRALYA